MKKIVLLIAFAMMPVAFTSVNAQTINRGDLIETINTLDSNIVGYFPRWRVCEPDLQNRIEQVFRIFGYPKDSLNKQKIIVTAAPKESYEEPYNILLLECGSQAMVSSEVSAYMDQLEAIINGEVIYRGPYKGELSFDGEPTYCKEDLKREIPLTDKQVEAITTFVDRPTNVDHAITLSVFNQALKIGSSGFWLESSTGNDEVGYHFWSAGEARVALVRPLYENPNVEMRQALPNLLEVRLGAAYRTTSGLDNDDDLFSFVSRRQLNTGPGGKLYAGVDFNFPFHPEAGISVDALLPFKRLGTEDIDGSTYAMMPYNSNERVITPSNPEISVDGIVPILRGTGQVTAFYHYWLDKKNPENYFRLDLGLNYTEVREAIFYRTDSSQNITVENVEGLGTYKPATLEDWIYAKLEYRNQNAFPFGASVQYSNQILLGRVYIPLLNNWLYLEGKYSTVLRDAYPWEIENFFMISPLVRITI